MSYQRLELGAIFLDSFDFIDHKSKMVIMQALEKGFDMKSAIAERREVLGEEKFLTINSSLNNAYIDKIVSAMQKAGVTAVTMYSKGYPEYLKNIHCPPLVLYAKGDLSLLEKDLRFGIVGSRKCLSTDKKTAEKYSEELSSSGVVIVTGIAEGIDSSVITGALKSGNIISVTAGGLDCLYPKENADLFNSVAQKGLTLSEQPLGIKPMPYMYPYRNRIIAGLSNAVMVVSAGLKSGTLHTVSYALEQGKDIFAVPHEVTSVSGAGCNLLIKEGAYLTDAPNDIIEFFGIEKQKSKILLDGFEKELYDIIASENGIHIDKIAVLTGKMPFELLPTLSLLEIKGVILKSAGNIYSTILN